MNINNTATTSTTKEDYLNLGRQLIAWQLEDLASKDMSEDMRVTFANQLRSTIETYIDVAQNGMRK